MALPNSSPSSALNADHVPSGVATLPVRVATVSVALPVKRSSVHEIVSQVTLEPASMTDERKFPEGKYWLSYRRIRPVSPTDHPFSRPAIQTEKRSSVVGVSIADQAVPFQV